MDSKFLRADELGIGLRVLQGYQFGSRIRGIDTRKRSTAFEQRFDKASL